MKNLFFIICSQVIFISLSGQRVTENDGDWSKQLEIKKNTAEASLMIRVGDIDNLGFGWDEGFNPFTGRPTNAHFYPWEINKADSRGTDRIMIPTSYIYNRGAYDDGYTQSTKRPTNNPVGISIPLSALKSVPIDSASLQLFVDDFQSPTMSSRFQFKINGIRFTEAEQMISKISQDGPIGKLITLRLTPELITHLTKDSLKIFIDDPTSGNGDGYSIDFVKLLINPKIIYKGSLSGRVIDAETREPISNAVAEVENYGMVQTDSEGNFTLKGIPAGLVLLKASAKGYSSAEKQADIIAGEEVENIELELRKSGKVTYNEKTLVEGDILVMNHIQFSVNSAELLPGSIAELDKLANLLTQNPTIEIMLIGHTSSEGTPQLNRELSLKRVRSCKDYLASKGIDEIRIAIKGFGPDLPIAPNDTEEGRAKNRRVEMRVNRL